MLLMLLLALVWKHPPVSFAWLPFICDGKPWALPFWVALPLSLAAQRSPALRFWSSKTHWTPSAQLNLELSHSVFCRSTAFLTSQLLPSSEGDGALILQIISSLSPRPLQLACSRFPPLCFSCYGGSQPSGQLVSIWCPTSLGISALPCPFAAIPLFLFA